MTEYRSLLAFLLVILLFTLSPSPLSTLEAHHQLSFGSTDTHLASALSTRGTLPNTPAKPRHRVQRVYRRHGAGGAMMATALVFVDLVPRVVLLMGRVQEQSQPTRHPTARLRGIGGFARSPSPRRPARVCPRTAQTSVD